MYAIVRSGGRQEKVAVGDVIETDRVSAEPGDLLPGGQRELVMLRDLSSEPAGSDVRPAAGRDRATSE